MNKDTNIKKDNNYKRYLVIKYEKYLSSKVRSSAEQTIINFDDLQEAITELNKYTPTRNQHIFGSGTNAVYIKHWIYNTKRWRRAEEED